MPNQLSKRKKHHPQRPKIFSVRALDTAEFMNYLEKSFEQENKFDSESEQAYVIPNEEQIHIEDRLWKYFLRKVEPYKNKVQKEKVNGWQKLMETIIKETQKKLTINQYHLEEIQKVIKEKYKQTHELYQQLQNLKKNKKKKEDHFAEKKSILQQNIEGINLEIEDLERNKKKINTQIKKMTMQKKSFLTNLLKNGYYKTNGAKWIIKKLKQMEYQPNSQDFPQFLDKKSTQYLLLPEKNPALNETVRTERRRHSHSTISELAKPSQLKDIYAGTREYLVKWIQKEGWKETIKLPKIKQTKSKFTFRSDSLMDEKKEEKRRIKNAYAPELTQRVKKIEFGIKLESE